MIWPTVAPLQIFITARPLITVWKLWLLAENTSESCDPPPLNLGEINFNVLSLLPRFMENSRMIHADFCYIKLFSVVILFQTRVGKWLKCGSSLGLFSCQHRSVMVLLTMKDLSYIWYLYAWTTVPYLVFSLYGTSVANPWHLVRILIRILLFSSLTFKRPTKFFAYYFLGTFTTFFKVKKS